MTLAQQLRTLESKAVRDALHEKETFLNTVFESIQEGISILDKDLNILRVNSLMRQWYAGNAPLEGKKCYKAYQNRSQPCDICPTVRCFESGQIESDIVPGLPDSDVMWIELFSYPIKDDDSGQVTGVVEFVRDISERVEAEKRIVEQNKYNKLRAEIWRIAADNSLIEDRSLIQKLLDTIGPALGVSRTAFLKYSPEKKAYVTELQWTEEGIKDSLGEDISEKIARNFYGQKYIEIPEDIDKVLNIPFVKQAVKQYTSAKLKKHNIKSYLVVPFGETDQPKGFFTFSDCETPKKWSELEKRILSEVVDIVSLRVSQIESEKRILDSIKEKDVMLKEIHHRVKNNMQIILSLLRLEFRKIEDDNVRRMLASCQKRIGAMSLVHETLYNSDNLAQIDFSEYIHKMSLHLQSIYSEDSRGIKVNIDAEELHLDINRAIPCGLIIGELVSNSLKHAFPNNQDGQISIVMKATQTGKYSLTVMDNGVGIPEDIDIHNTETLGMQLISDLVKQLNGQIELENRDGTMFRLLF